jgi:Electron transfer DM13
MAEGDRERDADTSGDDSAPEEEHAYDPGTGDEGQERDSETSGDDEPSEEDTAYDPESGGAEEEEEDKGPAFHPHDRARTEREWAKDDDEKQPEPDDPDALGGPSAEEERQKDAPDQDRDEDEDDDEEEAKGPPPPFRAFMLFVGTIAFLIIGLLLFSAVIAPTYIVALILAALWFVGAYFLLGRWTRNRRHLRFPIRIAFGGTVLVILLWIVINSVNGKTVHEPLVTGQKISTAEPTARIPEKPAKPTPPRNRLVSTGTFESAGAGSVKGQASYVQLQNGTVMVTIKGLDVTSAPTLHVFLATKDGKDVSAHKDLGSLKGNKGDMQYTIPPRTDPRQYKTVVIWNKAFGVPFARAETKLQ